MIRTRYVTALVISDLRYSSPMMVLLNNIQKRHFGTAGMTYNRAALDVRNRQTSPVWQLLVPCSYPVIATRASFDAGGTCCSTRYCPNCGSLNVFHS